MEPALAKVPKITHAFRGFNTVAGSHNEKGLICNCSSSGFHHIVAFAKSFLVSICGKTSVGAQVPTNTSLLVTLSPATGQSNASFAQLTAVVFTRGNGSKAAAPPLAASVAFSRNGASFGSARLTLVNASSTPGTYAGKDRHMPCRFYWKLSLSRDSEDSDFVAQQRSGHGWRFWGFWDAGWPCSVDPCLCS